MLEGVEEMTGEEMPKARTVFPTAEHARERLLDTFIENAKAQAEVLRLDAMITAAAAAMNVGLAERLQKEMSAANRESERTATAVGQWAKIYTHCCAAEYDSEARVK